MNVEPRFQLTLKDQLWESELIDLKPGDEAWPISSISVKLSPDDIGEVVFTVPLPFVKLVDNRREDKE